MKTKETFLAKKVDNQVAKHYIISEAGKECTVREGTGLWTYGLTLNYLPTRKWFNVKRSSQNGLTLNQSPDNGLILNRPVEMV